MSVPENKEKFSLNYLLTGDGAKDWYKAWGSGIRLLITITILTLMGLGIWGIYRYFFPKPKPISQTTNISMDKDNKGNVTIINKANSEEKLNEIGIFGGGIYFDDKPGGFAGIGLKRRF